MRVRMPEGCDETTGEYVGPCPKCESDHGWHPGPETVAGAMECIRRRASALGDTHLADRESHEHRQWQVGELVS